MNNQEKAPQDTPERIQEKEREVIRMQIQVALMQKECQYAGDERGCQHQWVEHNAEDFKKIFDRIVTDERDVIEEFSSHKEDLIEEIHGALVEKHHSVS